MVFGDPLEKSILAVARITRAKFIRNQKIKYFLLVFGKVHKVLDFLKRFYRYFIVVFYLIKIKESKKKKQKTKIIELLN